MTTAGKVREFFSLEQMLPDFLSLVHFEHERTPRASSILQKAYISSYRLDNTTDLSLVKRAPVLLGKQRRYSPSRISFHGRGRAFRRR